MALFGGSKLFNTALQREGSPYTQQRPKTTETTTTQGITPPSATTPPPAGSVDVDTAPKFSDYKAAYEAEWNRYVTEEVSQMRSRPGFALIAERNLMDHFNQPGVKEQLMAMNGWFNPATQTLSTIEDENGNPVATGYWVNGQFYVVNDLRGVAQAQQELAGITTPTYSEWLQQKGLQPTDVRESSAWQGLQDIVAQLASPEQQQQWLEQGIGQAEQLMGIEPGQYGGTLQDLLSQMGEVRGRNPQELSAMQERDIAQQTARAREDTKLIIESLGASGRSVQALMAADEISSSIANQEIQGRLKYAEFNFAQNEAEYAKIESQYNTMVQNGMMSATEYIQRQREHAALQLAAYAQEVQMIESGNRDYLMQYQADLQGMQQHAEQIYNQIQLSLGVDEALIGQMQQYYEAALAPLYFQMEQAKFALAEREMDLAERSSMWDSAISLIGLGVKAIWG